MHRGKKGLPQLRCAFLHVEREPLIAGAPHERVHQLLPGIEEVRVAAVDAGPAVLSVPDDAQRFYLARDMYPEARAVYVEEVSSGARPIQAVGTAVAAFVGIVP